MNTIDDRPHADDAQLIDAVRRGEISAYGNLYTRHVASAHRLARQLSRTQIEADDLVSEAFIRVLFRLRAGGGPDSALRAYLLTALRHAAYERTRKERRIELHADVTAIVDGASIYTPSDEELVELPNRTMVKRVREAYTGLPERWRKVLWLTEVKRMTPAEIAPSFGITANAVSALAYRARKALQLRYSQASAAPHPHFGRPVSLSRA